MKTLIFWSQRLLGPAGINLKALVVVGTVPILGWATFSVPTPNRFSDTPDDPIAEQVILRYAALAGQTQQGLKVKAASADSIRALGSAWRDGALGGELQPMKDLDYDDSMEDGVKASVLHTAMQLSDRLTVLASDDLAKGQFDPAAHDTMLALQTTETLRNSDLSSIILIVPHDRFLMDRLAEIAPKASAATRHWIAMTVSPLALTSSQANSVVATAQVLGRKADDRVSAIQAVDPNATIDVIPTADQIEAARHAATAEAESLKSLLSRCAK